MLQNASMAVLVPAIIGTGAALAAAGNDLVALEMDRPDSVVLPGVYKHDELYLENGRVSKVVRRNPQPTDSGPRRAKKEKLAVLGHLSNVFSPAPSDELVGIELNPGPLDQGFDGGSLPIPVPQRPSHTVPPTVVPGPQVGQDNGGPPRDPRILDDHGHIRGFRSDVPFHERARWYRQNEGVSGRVEYITPPPSNTPRGPAHSSDDNASAQRPPAPLPLVGVEPNPGPPGKKGKKQKKTQKQQQRKGKQTQRMLPGLSQNQFHNYSIVTASNVTHGRGMRISGRQRWCDIATDGTNNSKLFYIPAGTYADVAYLDPNNGSHVPAPLSTLAQPWLRFKPVRVSIEYVPVATSFTSSVAFAIAASSDPSLSATTFNNVCSFGCSKVAPVYQKFTLEAPIDKVEIYIRGASTTPSLNVPLMLVGAWAGDVKPAASATMYGSLYISYTIEFYEMATASTTAMDSSSSSALPQPRPPLAPGEAIQDYLQHKDDYVTNFGLAAQLAKINQRA